jgi:hypothetical protein
VSAETQVDTPERRLADHLDRLERDVAAGSRSLTSVLAEVYLIGLFDWFKSTARLESDSSKTETPGASE